MKQNLRDILSSFLKKLVEQKHLVFKTIKDLDLMDCRISFIGKEMHV